MGGRTSKTSTLEEKRKLSEERRIIVQTAEENREKRMEYILKQAQDLNLHVFSKNQLIEVYQLVTKFDPSKPTTKWNLMRLLYERLGVTIPDAYGIKYLNYPIENEIAEHKRQRMTVTQVD